MNSTIDHDEIRRWVESRRGTPAFALIKNTRVPMIDFASGLSFIMNVSWEEWFQVFDQERHAFVCKETCDDGLQSRFYQLIPRDLGELARVDLCTGCASDI
jgi:hypothetical protein